MLTIPFLGCSGPTRLGRRASLYMASMSGTPVAPSLLGSATHPPRPFVRRRRADGRAHTHLSRDRHVRADVAVSSGGYLVFSLGADCRASGHR